MKNRSKIEIFGEILRATNESSTGTTRIKIMYKAYLSHVQMKDYLTALTERDLLLYDGQTHTFKITEKGLRFLETYDRMHSMLRAEQ